MEYKEIYFLCGWTIERAIKELHERAKDGNKYCGDFNGNKLTSDMSLDDAYMLCIGKTFEQFNKEQEEHQQRLIQEEEENKRKIPELSKYWIEEGHKMTIEQIAENAPLMNKEQIINEIKKLIKDTEEQMSELLSEVDYKYFYETAKDYWVAYDMPVKGNVKDIHKCMWKAFEKAGFQNVHSKKEFLSFSKFLYKKHSILDCLYDEMMK